MQIYEHEGPGFSFTGTPTPVPPYYQVKPNNYINYTTCKSTMNSTNDDLHNECKCKKCDEDKPIEGKEYLIEVDGKTFRTIFYNKLFVRLGLLDDYHYYPILSVKKWMEIPKELYKPDFIKFEKYTRPTEAGYYLVKYHHITSLTAYSVIFAEYDSAREQWFCNGLVIDDSNFLFYCKLEIRSY